MDVDNPSPAEKRAKVQNQRERQMNALAVSRQGQWFTSSACWTGYSELMPTVFSDCAAGTHSTARPSCLPSHSRWTPS